MDFLVKLFRSDLAVMKPLVMLFFCIGLCIPINTLAQTAPCPSGTIGNCTNLEIISQTCINGCTNRCDSWAGGRCCEHTSYNCAAPEPAVYRVNECNPGCVDWM
jgi:hypothetical protein